MMLLKLCSGVNYIHHLVIYPRRTVAENIFILASSSRCDIAIVIRQHEETESDFFYDNSLKNDYNHIYNIV